jgi:hypothetical protein
MFQALCALLFSPDLWVLGAVHVWKRKAAGLQPWPYDWKNRADDPVYKKNLQRLIERNREFEDARK